MQVKFSDGQSEFSRVFNFAILGYSRNSRKLDARENIVFYSMHLGSKKIVIIIHIRLLQYCSPEVGLGQYKTCNKSECKVSTDYNTRLLQIHKLVSVLSEGKAHHL